MPPKRGSRAAAKAETIKVETIKDEDATRPFPKPIIDLSQLKFDLWHHYSDINEKIRNSKPLDRVEDTIENQHQRGADDEDSEHAGLKKLLEPFANIYDYDYDVNIAKDLFKKNSKNFDEDEYTSLIWAIKLSSKDNIRYRQIQITLSSKTN